MSPRGRFSRGRGTRSSLPDSMETRTRESLHRDARKHKEVQETRIKFYDPGSPALTINDTFSTLKSTARVFCRNNATRNARQRLFSSRSSRKERRAKPLKALRPGSTISEGGGWESLQLNYSLPLGTKVVKLSGPGALETRENRESPSTDIFKNSPRRVSSGYRVNRWWKEREISRAGSRNVKRHRVETEARFYRSVSSFFFFFLFFCPPTPSTVF